MFFLTKYTKPLKFSIFCLFIFVTFMARLNFEGKFSVFKLNYESVEANYTSMELEELSRAKNRSIIFIEGYFNDYLSPRMLCSIESAALIHKNTPINVIMTSKTLKMTPSVTVLLRNYRNIGFFYLNSTKLYLESPLRNWFQVKIWKKSKWPKTNFSDPLRFLLLWHYGGIYLDMDVLVIRNLLKETNFIGVQSRNFANTAVLGFSARNLIVWDSIEEMTKSFDGNIWGFNGPHLITKVLIKRCGENFQTNNNSSCLGVRILEEKVFYVIPWQNSKSLFESDMTLVKKILEDSNILAVHSWNFLTHDIKLPLDYPSCYSLLAKRFCPFTVQKSIKNTL